MQVETRDPKVLLGGAFALIAALMGGSFMGFTIEPKETTLLRTEAALLRQRVEILEEDIETCVRQNPGMKLASLESELPPVTDVVVTESTVSAAVEAPEEEPQVVEAEVTE